MFCGYQCLGAGGAGVAQLDRSEPVDPGCSYFRFIALFGTRAPNYPNVREVRRRVQANQWVNQKVGTVLALWQRHADAIEKRSLIGIRSGDAPQRDAAPPNLAMRQPDVAVLRGRCAARSEPGAPLPHPQALPHRSGCIKLSMKATGSMLRCPLLG